jgi:small-conductance mechanosensitive channel
LFVNRQSFMPYATTRRVFAVFLPTAVLLLFLMGAIPASGQISVLKNAVEKKEPGKPKAPETPEEARARFEKWHQQAQQALEGLNASEAAVPAGITPDELDARRRDLEQIILVATRSIKNLKTVDEGIKALEASETASAAWKGFEQKPPYSLLMVDELLNERDAIREKLTSYESSLLNYQGILASAVDETKAAENAVSSLITAVEDADATKTAAAKWRLEAARAKSRLNAARVGLLQSGIENFQNQIAAARNELSLIDRKVQTAKADARLSDEDLAKIGKISAERKKSVQKESDAISQRLKTARAAKAKAESSLKELNIPAESGTKPAGLELAEYRVQVAGARVDSLQSIMETLESLIQMENIHWSVYQKRRTLIDAATPEERTKALAEINATVERLRAWENVLQNETATCRAELSKLESRAGSVTLEDPRFSLINDQRSAISEQLDMLRRLVQSAASVRRLAGRWADEYAPKPGEDGFFQKVSNFGSSAWNFTKAAWSYEVMSFDDSYTTEDGVVISRKIPVRLGMLLRAILFFAIGYFISSRVANHIQRRLVRAGHMMDAQARTLRNWAMIIVGVFLILGTLAFLRIPLTVFAFFGGALAIGVGFGTQTLIKNFISGIIVLAERKVRVGDILDVDGIVGTVVEVNTRSSIIRSADDVETVIPNSLFLENRVTNWTLSSSKMRRTMRVGVAYGTEPRTVMDILTESAGRHGRICKDPAPFAVFEDFGDSALLFSLYFWLELGTGNNPIVVTSDLRLMIEKRFSEAGIGVPFPQRDMHLTTDKPLQVQITHEG